MDPEESDGDETERSSSGTASRASEGDTLGEGELDRRSGESTLLDDDGLVDAPTTPTAQSPDIGMNDVTRCSGPLVG